jgi:hypothetical protein
MKRLLPAMLFSLVLMVIGTSIAFSGGYQHLSTRFPDQKTISGPKVTAGFVRIWKNLHYRN